MGEPAKCQKSYFDVLGICCPSEVPLVKKLLEPLRGVQKVTAIVPSRTVIVVHDANTISQSRIVEALNQARLDASVRAYGTGAEKISNKWPSPFSLVCGVLLSVSLFERFWHPLKWFAFAGAIVGLVPLFWRTMAAARRRTLDMVNILMLIAVPSAMLLKDFTEAGSTVFVFTVAEWLQARVSRKDTAGMPSLMSVAPQNAVLAETGQVVAIQDVNVNTVIAVKAGEVIPLDGVVVHGRSEVDESTLTGESYPVAKQENYQVWARTLNIDGYIAVRTTAMADNSVVAKMISLVEEAQNSRSNTQRLIDKCAKYYTPAVIVMAAGVVLFHLLARAHNLKHWFSLQKALVLLVSACPCALVLSTPVATCCALQKAARTGLLIKGGNVLESLASIKVVAFDKTGTITRGEFCVEEFQAVGKRVPEQQVLYWVSSIESRPSHPMAAALVDYAKSNSVEPKSENVSEFQIYPGEGIYGEIGGHGVYIGNKKVLSRALCQIVDIKDTKGFTVVYVVCNKELIGVFNLSDSCQTGAAEAINELISMGIKPVMLTGDCAAAATFAHNQLGNILSEVHSELLPEDKVRILDELKEDDGPTLMIGDGMNDAPALSKADVGVSMGVSGSAVAVEASHIALMSNDIGIVPKAIKLARRTRLTIIVNIIFSLITKLVIVVLAFAGHPLVWAAVLADAGTCLLVIMYTMLSLRNRVSGKRVAPNHHGSYIHSKKHGSSHHCSDCPCRTTEGCIDSSADKCAYQDHHQEHNHCKKQSNLQSKDKQGCHDHSHGHNPYDEPGKQLATSNHVSHDHAHSHNYCLEPSNLHSISKHDLLLSHEHSHRHCEELSSLHFLGVHACNHHQHSQCEETSSSHSTGEHDRHQHKHYEEPISLHYASEHACHYHHHGHGHDAHSCHGHRQDSSAADSIQEHSILIDVLVHHHEHREEHKGEDCGHGPKTKTCAPTPTDWFTLKKKNSDRLGQQPKLLQYG